MFVTISHYEQNIKRIEGCYGHINPESKLSFNDVKYYKLQNIIKT